jgi:hypothetical protein
MRPSPAFVAIGCQGRGIGWQTVMGAELAKLATQTGYNPVLHLTPVKTTFHQLKALGVSATIAAYRVLDRFGIS